MLYGAAKRGNRYMVAYILGRQLAFRKRWFSYYC